MKSEPKVILYYRFVPVPDPETTMWWQKELCRRLGLRGRIIVSQHGINGTLGGPLHQLKRYRRAMNDHPRFRGIEYKWSAGTGDDFPRLSVKVRRELVTLDPDIEFDPFDVGIGLRPAAWHRLLETRDDLQVLDARNAYESEIGRFEGAITPAIDAFREIKDALASLDPERPVATYCTGDIRCEYLSAYMKAKGFSEVYHLDGGIVKYGEAFGDAGRWEGRCYVFDNRKHVSFSESATDIATCSSCSTSTSRQANCTGDGCRSQIVLCEPCESAAPPRCRVCESANISGAGRFSAPEAH